LQELTDWCFRAARELAGAPQSDPRWPVYNEFKAEADALDKEISDLELQQEAALTEIVKSGSPIVLEMEDGTHKTLAATPGDRGAGGSLLPRDLLNVWRIAKVFEGSVVMGGQPTRLSFGSADQALTVRLAKKPKKDAVVSEDGHLFGRD
jgi:sugar diacid utilization regulator